MHCLFIGQGCYKAKWIEIDRLRNNATAKEKNLMTLIEVVYEMYLRGINLLPLTFINPMQRIYITKEGILPPLASLQE